MFSNRFLTSNSQRAASKKGPLSYERAKSLAGNVCVDRGHPREPQLGAPQSAAESRADQRGRHLGRASCREGGREATRTTGEAVADTAGAAGVAGTTAPAGRLSRWEERLSVIFTR